MLSFECGNCDNDDKQGFVYHFDYETNTLYTICDKCGHKELVTIFEKR